MHRKKNKAHSSMVLESMHTTGQDGVNLLQPIPLPSTSHLMLGKTGPENHKGDGWTYVLVIYPSPPPQKYIQGCGENKACTTDSLS